MSVASPTLRLWLLVGGVIAAIFMTFDRLGSTQGYPASASAAESAQSSPAPAPAQRFTLSRSTAPAPRANSAQAQAGKSRDAKPLAAGAAGIDSDCEEHTLAAVERDLSIRMKPGAGAVVGTLEASSKYLGERTVAWVLETTGDKRYGRVTLPWSGTDATGWISLRGAKLSTTQISVRVHLDSHEIEVTRCGKTEFRLPTATGSSASPTPTGRYYVTDRVETGMPQSQFGHYAFGLSGKQTNLPAGWTGGDQLAIHGTNVPSSIGRSVSAGCLRISRDNLERLKPLLRLGTPVIVTQN